MINEQTQKSLNKVVNLWTLYANPLRNITRTMIDQIIDLSKCGNDVRLQLAFANVERLTPLFGVVINKRLSGILARKWKILPLDESQAAKDQADEVQKLFDKADLLNKDGLSEAFRHLGMSTFRGRSVVKPFLTEDGLLFKKIDNWNILDYNGKLYFNPSADQGLLPGQKGLVEVPDDEVCVTREDRPVDIPGLQVYLRLLIGETQWARFVEKQGVPQIVLQGGDSIPASEYAEWQYRAQQIQEGGSGILPENVKLQQLTEARGQDPFSEFLQHQSEMIVLLATGSTLGTLPGSTGLGSNLAEIQDNQFNQLINYDCKKIANTINACAVKMICDKMFDGRRLCKFDFVEEKTTSAKEYIEMAKQLVDAGFTVDVAELKKLVKLPFIDDTTQTWRPEAETK